MKKWCLGRWRTEMHIVLLSCQPTNQPNGTICLTKIENLPSTLDKVKVAMAIGKHILPFSCYTHGHRQSTSTNALVIVGFLNGQDKNYGDAKLSTPIS